MIDILEIEIDRRHSVILVFFLMSVVSVYGKYSRCHYDNIHS